jgi:hypothetical protein
MTLNMKFFYTTFFHSNENRCEEIADDFAIGFAQWFHENCYEDNVGYYRAEELLETYKQEKGL